MSDIPQYEQCDLCCCFGTYNRTLVGQIARIVVPNGKTIKRTLYFLQDRQIGNDYVPLCTNCISAMEKQSNKT